MKALKNWLIIGLISLPLFVTIGFNIWHHNEIIDLKKSLTNDRLTAKVNSQLKNMTQIEPLKKGSKYVTLDLTEFEKLNTEISSLTMEVNNQYQYAQDLINNDIDRLNLYITVGIGFLGLMGIFIPIFVNIMTIGDIREKQVEMKATLDKTSDNIEKAETQVSNALNDAKNANEKAEEALTSSKKLNGLEPRIIEVEKRANESLPVIDTLIIQNAIGRFFNMSPYVLTSVKDSDRQHLIEILGTIKEGFSSCSKLNKNPSIDKFLKAILKDFKVYILNRRYVTGSLSKPVMVLFDKLPKYLELLEGNSDVPKINEYYSNIVSTLDNIILEIKPTK